MIGIPCQLRSLCCSCCSNGAFPEREKTIASSLYESVPFQKKIPPHTIPRAREPNGDPVNLAYDKYVKLFFFLADFSSDPGSHRTHPPRRNQPAPHLAGNGAGPNPAVPHETAHLRNLRGLSATTAPVWPGRENVQTWQRSGWQRFLRAGCPSARHALFSAL